MSGYKSVYKRTGLTCIHNDSSFGHREYRPIHDSLTILRPSIDWQYSILNI